MGESEISPCPLAWVRLELGAERAGQNLIRHATIFHSPTFVRGMEAEGKQGPGS